MKKIVFALVALIVAAPAFGDALDISAVQVGSTLDVNINYNAPGTLPRGFGLDITVDNGQTITDISNFIIGESVGPGNKGFGIFPANFARYIDPEDPNTWGDANYTPVADPCDLPGDTEGGLGTSGITIEMGSLYVGGPNSPPASGTLCTITVSGGCHVSLAANVGRGKVVLEDGNEPSPLTLTGCDVVTQVAVPDVTAMNETDANTAIDAAGLDVGVIDRVCSEVEAEYEVLDQDPNGGEMVDPGSLVDLTISRGGSPLDCGCCLGDVDKSNYVYASDYDAMINLLNSFYAADGSYYRPITHADYINNPCADIDKNSYIYASDYDAIINLLNALYAENGSYYRDCTPPGYTPPPGF